MGRGGEVGEMVGWRVKQWVKSVELRMKGWVEG